MVPALAGLLALGCDASLADTHERVHPLLHRDSPADGRGRAQLLDSPGYWSTEPARDAEARGQQLLAEVGFGPPGARIGKRVELQFGEPVRFPSKAILPMSWKPAGLDSLFPRLDADVEVGELGPERTQLSISARYTPPLGSLGRVLDRALLHRVAEATVKDFLDRAAQILSPVPATSSES
jgi:hypothetical protein